MNKQEEKTTTKAAEKKAAESNGAAHKAAEKSNPAKHENGSPETSFHPVSPAGAVNVTPAVKLDERIKNVRDLTQKIASKELLEEALKEVSRFNPNGNSNIRLNISNGMDNWSTSNTVILEETLNNLKGELKKKVHAFETQIIEMTI